MKTTRRRIMVDILVLGGVGLVIAVTTPFGVRASVEGCEGRGDVKLIDGLWYYDSQYGDEFSRYTRRINAALEKGRQLRASRRAPQAPVPQQK